MTKLEDELYARLYEKYKPAYEAAMERVLNDLDAEFFGKEVEVPANKASHVVEVPPVKADKVTEVVEAPVDNGEPVEIVSEPPKPPEPKKPTDDFDEFAEFDELPKPKKATKAVKEAAIQDAVEAVVEAVPVLEDTTPTLELKQFNPQDLIDGTVKLSNIGMICVGQVVGAGITEFDDVIAFIHKHAKDACEVSIGVPWTVDNLKEVLKTEYNVVIKRYREKLNAAA